MNALRQILDEQDRRDMHGQTVAGARVNHLGLSDHSVAEVCEAVAARPRPAIRSGHVGNWEEIWLGQVGLVDYNRYICRDLGLGVPVIHAHTFTETADLSDGDTIYLPAGRIHRRTYERMPIFVKQGEDFVAVDPGESVCCAFAHVEADTGMVPLVQARASELEPFTGATTIPTLLGRDDDLLRRALRALVDDALDAPGALSLDQVFGSSVSRQGQRGSAPVIAGEGFTVNGTPYATRDDLVAAAVLALEFGSLAATEVHAQVQPTNDYLPLLGAATVLALVAYLDCHVAGDDLHAHWGAISMSGYPPVAGGYFGRRATRRTLRNIGDALARLEEFDFGMRFALLPAPVLSLLPPAEFSTDCGLVDDLITTVLEKTELPKADPSGAVAEIGSVVRTWLTDHQSRLSPYYLNRFGLARSVFNGTAQVPTDGAPHDPTQLGALTMRQASILLGSLIEEAKRLPAGDST